MNKTNYQKIFKRSAVDQLYSDLRSGRSVKNYFSASFKLKKKDILVSTIKLSKKLPELKVPSKDIASTDLENAIKLYELYKDIDETQASDPRLWVYLAHVDYRKYAISRWGLRETEKDLKKDEALKRAINFITEHWFPSGNDRDLRRNALARLWWAAHLTYAPWERDAGFFEDLEKKDPYYFTRVLLSTQDIYQTLLERSMNRSNRILISILEYLGNNKKFAESRENIRNLAKELNLILGARQIIMLDRKSLKELIEKIGGDITSNSK